MAIYDFWLSRNNGPTLQNYVGHSGRLFYDSDEKVLRVSDGVTPGGSPINSTILVSTTEPAVAVQGQLWYNPSTFELWAYHNSDFKPTIDLATDIKIGGIKLGPGVTVNGQGQLIIDSEGLDFSFGDFAALTGTYPADYYEPERQNDDYAVLSSISANEDIVLASNGTGAVRVVGDFSVRRANGNLVGALNEQPIFRVRSDGQVRMLVPAADSAEGAFTIVGGLNAVFQPPVNTGVMLHITGIAGDPGVPSRLYNDAQNAFAAFVARRYNGTAASPTAVLANEEIMRLSGTAHNGNIIPTTASQRIVFRALGNQTLSNQGGSIEFWATPLNTNTLVQIATIDEAGITLNKLGSSLKLFGNTSGTITIQANATAGTNTVTFPARTGTVITTGDTGTVTNAMMANNSVTVNGTTVSLGGTGTVTAAAGTLTGTTLASNVVNSNLTSVGILTSLSVADGISDASGNVRSVPINNQTGAYNLAATDNGKMISITTGGVSVLQNVFTSPYGQIVSVFNDSNTSQTITQGSGVTLRLAGTAATGNRTLARYGVATITCVAANTFVISGAGLT